MNKTFKSFKDFILEQMTPEQAHSVFSKFGINSRGKDPEELKSHYKKLISKHHPDRGGNVADAQEINSAWDTLKNAKSSLGGSTRDSRASRQSHYEPSGKVPEWAWAGHSGGMPPSSRISRNDYSDYNFIKKDMWNKSGGSNQEYTIHHFDGNHFRRSITVYGNDNIYRHMAMASHMFNGDYRSKAIFVSRPNDPRKLKMIWANGKHLKTHPETEHESFNHNPSNDRHFTSRLSDWIDRNA